VSLNPDNKIIIDKYISNNPESKLDKTFPISLKGQKKDLHIYLLPTELLFYNIRNGRFAAEYKELVKREGGHLEPENQDDAKKIRDLLLNLDRNETIKTYEDIKIRGQWNCGIISEDGYLVDGNRRMSILSKLYEDTGQEKWKFIEVAKLDESIGPEDLWSLEAGIQLGKDEIVRYGPINELLKLKEGVDAGLSLKSIVKTLYGYEDEEEINIKLKRLELIEQYLGFIGSPEKYSLVKNKHDHFIDLQNVIGQCKKISYDPEKIGKIKHVAFELILEGKINSKDLRKIRQMVEQNNLDAIDEIEKASTELKPHLSKQESIESTTEDVIDEFEENEQEISTTLTHFINATDALDVQNNDGKELLLLNRAEKNLKPLLEYTGDDLPKEAKLLIEKILQYSTELKAKFCR
jgi:hypothetical protein